MLSNFQVAETPLLQSFLLGQEEFRGILQGPGMEQLRQRVIASCQLNPLTEQETRDYIEHRLGVVGWHDTPHFSEAAYAAIFHCTQGVPRRINMLCDRLLLYGFLEEIHEFDEDSVMTVHNELFQSAASSAQASGAVPSVPGATVADEPNAISNAEVTRRLSELEDVVESLVRTRRHLEGGPQRQQLERRVADMEPVVDSLREGFMELARVVDKALNAKAD